jgi:hypothetical protein
MTCVSGEEAYRLHLTSQPCKGAASSPDRETLRGNSVASASMTLFRQADWASLRFGAGSVKWILATSQAGRAQHGITMFRFGKRRGPAFRQ